MIDCSHANSQKRHENQIPVGADVAAQLAGGEERIIGVMVESHINAGAAGPGARQAARVRRLDHRRVHRLGRDGYFARHARERSAATTGNYRGSMNMGEDSMRGHGHNLNMLVNA